MRIVMITDDGANIDRRIFLEAKTLMEEGHEVILLARQVEDVPQHQVIDGLKIERLALDAPRPLELRYRALLHWLLPKWMKRPAGKVLDLAEEVRFIGKAITAVLLNIYHYNQWDIREKKRLLANANLSRKQRYRLRFAITVRRGIAASAAFLPGLGKLALKLRDRLAYSRSRVFEPNIWDRAIARRVVYFDPDIIHAHDLPQLYGAVLAKRRLKVPLVYDAHEAYPEIDTLTPEQKAFLRIREKKLIRETDQAYTVNPYIARFMEERYHHRPIKVIMNATEPPAGFVPGKHDDRIRKRLKLGSDQQLLIFQGWMANVGRGLAELVEGMGLVRENIHLVMMGYGDTDFFKDIARKAGVEDRVHCLDPVPWEELIAWSAAADAGIIPYQPVDLNHRYCSPNKLFEFIAARLPILANDLPFLKEVVEGEGFGIARPLDTPESMAKAINEMFDPALGHLQRARAALMEKGPHWEWREEAKKLRSIYNELTPPKPAPYRALPAKAGVIEAEAKVASNHP